MLTCLLCIIHSLEHALCVFCLTQATSYIYISYDVALIFILTYKTYLITYNSMSSPYQVSVMR